MAVNEKTGKFKLGTVNGVVVEKEFDYKYDEFETFEDVTASEDWDNKKLLELVNSATKANAKSAAYQKEAKPYLPDPSDPAEKRKTAIRNLMSLGVPKEIAEQTIDAAVSSQKQ